MNHATLLAFSKNLTLLWSYDDLTSVPMWPYVYPVICQDDNVIVYDDPHFNHANVTAIILDRNGVVLVKNEGLPEVPIPSCIVGWTAFHLETILSADKSHSDICAVAYDLTTGRPIWNTTLATSWTPDTSTAWALGRIFENEGKLYTICVTQGLPYKLYALDLNGTVLWSKPMEGQIQSTFPNGGLLVFSNGVFTKISANGDKDWDLDSKVGGGSCQNIIGADDTLYYSNGTAVLALSQTSTLASPGPLLVDMAVMILVVTSFIIWTSGRQKRT